MDGRPVATLDQILPEERERWGGKAAGLARLHQFGHPVPAAAVIDAAASRAIEAAGPVAAAIRKARSYDGYPAPTREIWWDQVRLRIRQEPLPGELVRAVRAAVRRLWPEGIPPLAVRSSAVEEDSEAASFAGIYRSRLDVRT